MLQICVRDSVIGGGWWKSKNLSYKATIKHHGTAISHLTLQRYREAECKKYLTCLTLTPHII